MALSTESLAPNAEESAITAPHVPESEASAEVTLQQAVGQSGPSVRQGPRRRRTVEPDHQGTLLGMTRGGAPGNDRRWGNPRNDRW